MMRAIKILCGIGCWACIVCAAIFYGVKAGAFVAAAIFLEAIIAAVMIEESEKECDYCIKECKKIMSNMEDDGK